MKVSCKPKAHWGGAILLSDYSKDTKNFSRPGEYLKKARAGESTLVENLTQIHASKPNTKDDVPDVNQQNDTHIRSKQQKTKKNVSRRRTLEKKFPQEKKQAEQTKHQLKNGCETALCEPLGKAKFTPGQNQPSSTTDMRAQETHISKSQSEVVDKQARAQTLRKKLAERTKRQSKRAYEIGQCVALGKPKLTPGQNRQSKTTHMNKSQSGVVDEQAQTAQTLKKKLAPQRKPIQPTKLIDVSAQCAPTQRQMTLPAKYDPKSKLSASNRKRKAGNDQDQDQNETKRTKMCNDKTDYPHVPKMPFVSSM